MTELTNLLAIETSTSSCSVALWSDGNMFFDQQNGQNIHSDILLSMIRELVMQSGVTLQQLSAISVSHGPGSFTGLRIGVGVAQGIAYANNIPLIGVDSLTILANELQQDGYILAGLDARMQEIYWAVFERKQGNLCQLGELKLTSPERIDLVQLAGVGKVKGISFVGNAWSVYKDKISASVMSYCDETALSLPNAQSLVSYVKDNCTLDNAVDACQFELMYVRNDVAKKSQKALFV